MRWNTSRPYSQSCDVILFYEYSGIPSSLGWPPLQRKLSLERSRGMANELDSMSLHAIIYIF